MLTPEEITIRYNNINTEFGNNKGRCNVYSCPSCNNKIKVQDIDNGTTPFLIKCPFCNDMAQSKMYSYISDILITHEFYRPSLEETLTYADNPYLLEHILNGGLQLRPRHEERPHLFELETPDQYIERVNKFNTIIGKLDATEKRDNVQLERYSYQFLHAKDEYLLFMHRMIKKYS